MGIIIKTTIQSLLVFLSWMGIADFAVEAFLHAYFSSISTTSTGKMRANVYVLLTSKPVDCNRYVDDYITEYNLLPGNEIERVGDAVFIRVAYVLTPQVKIYLLRALVKKVDNE